MNNIINAKLDEILNSLNTLKGELNALLGIQEPMPYLSAAQKAWVTRRERENQNRQAAKENYMSPAKKAWATRRANAAANN